MKTRIDVGTDIARLGAWDASLQEATIPPPSEDYLDAEANAARLFLIKTGADCGGPLDLYVDEPLPDAVQSKLRRAGNGPLRVSVPSGRLLIGGVEDYRSDSPRITGASSIATVPPGDYAVMCYVERDTEACYATPTSAQIRAALGQEDFRYLRKLERRSLAGYLHLLWWPILAPRLGWKWAAAIGVGLMMLHVLSHESWLKRNARYLAIKEKENALWRAAMAASDPTFVLVLRKLDDDEKLSGGSVRLHEDD